MNNLIKAEELAEKLRREPWRTFPMRSNCLGKSLRFREECHKIGIKARVIFSLGITRNDRIPFLPSMLLFHAWAEIDGRRIELARPLNEENFWNTFDTDIRPVIAIWI